MDKVEIFSQELTRDITEDGNILIQIKLSNPMISGAQHLKLNHCLKKTAENMAELISQAMLGEARAASKLLPEALPFRIDKNFTVTCNEHGIFSFFSDLRLYAGGLRGAIYRYGSTLRLRDGMTLFVSSLFPAATDIRKVVTDFVEQARRESDGAQSDSVREHADYFYTPENIYLTEQGLAVFYQPHTLGPSAGGIPVFILPYSEDGPYSPERLGLPERP